jgi:hypothetical protein
VKNVWTEAFFPSALTLPISTTLNLEAQSKNNSFSPVVKDFFCSLNPDVAKNPPFRVVGLISMLISLRTNKGKKNLPLPLGRGSR